MKKLLLIALLLCPTAVSAQAPTPVRPDLKSETEYMRAIAPLLGAEAEVRLPDGTRVGMLNAWCAFEGCWPEKWYGAVGQAMYYACATGRRPAVVILLRGEKGEERHVRRCLTVCCRYGIALYTINVREVE